MNIVKNTFIYLLAIFSIYLFAFNPVYLPLSSFGLVKCFYPLLLLFLLAEYRQSLKKFSKISRLYLIAVACCAIGAIMSSSNSVYTRSVNFIEIFLIPVIIAHLFLRFKIKLPFVILGAATLASFISLYAYLNSSFLFFLRSVQPVAESINDYTLSVRDFGFSSELYSVYGWSLGFITVYLLLHLKKYSFFVLALPLIFFAILINSRSGGLAVIIGFVVYALFNRKFSALASISFISIFLIFVIKNLDLGWINDGTMTFITDFFDQLSNILKGDRDNTYIGIYTGYQFVLPDNLFEWIFGRGFSLMGNKYGVASSDVGYLNDLAIGGLLYVLFVYKAYWKLFKLINVRWFYIASVTIFVVLNIKGCALDTNGLSRIFALVVFYESLHLKAYKNENN